MYPESSLHMSIIFVNRIEYNTDETGGKHMLSTRHFIYFKKLFIP